MNKSNLTIFNFDNYNDYLGYRAKLEKEKGEGSPLVKWAKRLGFNSPSSLTMVLKGQRLPSKDLVNALIFDLKLNPEEKRYFELLIRLEKLKRKNEDVSIVLKELSKFDQNNKHAISLNEFEYISDWYYLAIKQLIKTKEFQEDYVWISKKLKSKITPAKAKSAIATLIKLGILDRRKSGALYVKRESIESSNDIPSAAIKGHHKQMMERAIEAVYEEDVSVRQVNSMSFRIDPNLVDAAKEKVLQFIYEFNDEYGMDKAGGELYQLNVQLFGHTAKESVKSKKSN